MANFCKTTTSFVNTFIDILLSSNWNLECDRVTARKYIKFYIILQALFTFSLSRKRE